MADKFKIKRIDNVELEKTNEKVENIIEKMSEENLELKNSKFSLQIVEEKSETATPEPTPSSPTKTIHFADDPDYSGGERSHDKRNNTYGLHNTQRTFGRDTLEVLPQEHYYRNADTIRTKLFRPTLQHLHDREESKPTNERINELEQHRKQVQESRKEEENAPDLTANKFGWIQGVFVRCLLNIWGVILFLRMSWIVGEAGVIFSILIIGLATVVTVLTTISMSAICTNGVVKGGGAYFLISRSLGPEFGGAIGLIFSLANAVAVSMYTVGFSETVRDMLKENEMIMISEAHDVRIVGSLTLLLLLGITQAGMAWESKAQVFLLIILVVSIINYGIGCCLGREFDPVIAINDTSEFAFKKLNSEGHFNMKTSLLQENLWASYSTGENFFTVFSIFFPAATGILAGSNISGDLKDPSVAIPKGTFSAIGLTSVSYMILAVLLGAHSTRVASGFYGQTNETSGICQLNGTFVDVPGNCLDDYNEGLNSCSNQYSNVSCSLGWNYTIIDKCPAQFEDAGMNCRFGLKGDYATMSKISAVPHLITAGIFAATLSSALACLVSAPKVFQALANDKVIPKIEWFAKPYGKDGEARRAYALTFLIALGFILIGELNVIAPVISNFFLASYCLINYSCFSASLSKSPGWRPAFKYYNKWFALFASFICVAIMFIADWKAALITFACVAFVYKMISIRALDINWGSSGQALVYQQALKYTQRLARVDDHVKNFRPQILCLSGPVDSRPELVSLAGQMTHNLALCMFGDIQSSFAKIRDDTPKNRHYLERNKIKGVYKPTHALSLGEGAVQLMSSAGIGKLSPNIIMLGFMHSWKTRALEDMTSYYNMIHDAFTYNYAVVILHAPKGLNRKNSEVGMKGSSIPAVELPPSPTKSVKKSTKVNLLNCCTQGEEETLLGNDNLLFQGSCEERVIDVYWLFDDGGLTLLLPYILTLRKYWSKAKIRLFTPGKKDQLDRDQMQVSALCQKFRIETSEVEILYTLNQKPKDESIERFNELIAPFRSKEADEASTSETEPDSDIKADSVIDDDLLEKFKKKTNRQLRINELIRHHSAKSDLVCVTLPMVRVGSCPGALYMAWLDSISFNLPPVLMLRGNQESVLTFYS